MTIDAKTEVSATTLGLALGLSRKRVEQLAADGVVKRLAKGRYPLLAGVAGYVQFLKDEERRTSKSAAASRLHDVRAREVELRVAREEGRLIDVEDVQAAVGEIVGGLRSELAGLPAACTRDLALRRTIEKHLNAAIDRCRGRFEMAEQQQWSGGDAADADEASAGASNRQPPRAARRGK